MCDKYTILIHFVSSQNEKPPACDKDNTALRRERKTTTTDDTTLPRALCKNQNSLSVETRFGLKNKPLFDRQKREEQVPAKNDISQNIHTPCCPSVKNPVNRQLSSLSVYPVPLVYRSRCRKYCFVAADREVSDLQCSADHTKTKNRPYRSTHKRWHALEYSMHAHI